MVVVVNWQTPPALPDTSNACTLRPLGSDGVCRTCGAHVSDAHVSGVLKQAMQAWRNSEGAMETGNLTLTLVCAYFTQRKFEREAAAPLIVEVSRP